MPVQFGENTSIQTVRNVAEDNQNNNDVTLPAKVYDLEIASKKVTAAQPSTGWVRPSDINIAEMLSSVKDADGAPSLQVLRLFGTIRLALAA